jgi:hypothetical protein
LFIISWSPWGSDEKVICWGIGRGFFV